MFKTSFLPISILVIFLFYPILNFAQEFEYGLKYEGIGDNREYFSPYHEAETILGSRLAADVGFLIDSKHKFRTGFSYFYEYGSEFLELKPQLIMYYSFEENGLSFKMGAFPRIGNLPFPSVLLSSKYEYFNPTVDGILVSYKTDRTEYGIVVDWTSKQDSIRREQFWTGFWGKLNLNNFIVEEYLYMFHNANRLVRLPNDYIEDNLGNCFSAGYNFSSLVPIDILTVKTGVLTSAFRNRGDGSDFDIKTSSYSEIKADYNGYGVETILKFGNKHHFVFGNAFYRNAENYIHTKLYCTPFNTKRIKAQLSWSFHIANGDLDNQQQFRLIYLIGDI